MRQEGFYCFKWLHFSQSFCLPVIYILFKQLTRKGILNNGILAISFIHFLPCYKHPSIQSLFLVILKL